MGGRGASFGGGGGGNISIPVGKNQTFYKAVPNSSERFLAIKGETFSQGGRVFGIEKEKYGKYPNYTLTDTATGTRVGSAFNRTRKAAVSGAEDFLNKIKNMDNKTSTRVQSAEKEMQKYLRKKAE